MARRYDPRPHFWRNKVCMSVILTVIGVPVVKARRYHYAPYQPKNDTFLLIANHNDILDPDYEMVHLRRYIRYVASDHVVRQGLFGKLVQFFGTPIVKHRDRPSEELTRDIRETLKNGVSVGLHAEGGTSLNGESRYISPNTAKLVKDADCAVITYRMHGGYLRSPRWAVRHRKGPLYGGVVQEYSREELQRMTETEVYDAICRDLYVNVYDEQRKDPQLYTGQNLAEHCEIVLYLCPNCGGVGMLHSMGDYLFCDCGYQLRMEADGFFHDCGAGVVYDNIRDWDLWQKPALREYVKTFSQNFADPIFRDDRQIIRRVEGDTKHLVTEQGVLKFYYDRIELHWPGTDLTWAMGDVHKLDYVSHQSLLLITEDSYFDIGSAYPRSPTKYIEAWRFLTNRPSY
jgi:1-acyl-sn-glycerol-3-phosphate acyltransferase